MSGVVAQGTYKTAVVAGGFVVTAGVTPRTDGQLAWRGKVGADLSVADARTATALATTNAISAAEEAIPVGQRLERCLHLVVYINATDDFDEHARVADAASDVIVGKLGFEGMGSRAAIGVASLPGGAPVEIQFTGVVSTAAAHELR
jgi:enamine deaminase RidA (YjgF/YER057c/UK114 family)